VKSPKQQVKAPVTAPVEDDEDEEDDDFEDEDLDD